MTPRTGRPPLPEGQARTAVLRIRFTKAEYDLIVKATLADGGPEWMRATLLRAAKTKLKPPKT